MTRYIDTWGKGRMVEFTTVLALKRGIREQQDLLQSGTAATQLIGLTNVSELSFEKISDLRDRGSLPKSLKFLYDSLSEILIIKIPTACHEVVSCLVAMQMEGLLAGAGLLNTRDYNWIGSTRFTGSPNSQRSKEPDGSFLPASRSMNNGDYPSFVVETGVSERLHQLRLDAEFWLLNTNNQCKLVLIIYANRISGRVIMELYRRGQAPGRVTRNTPNPPPRAAIALTAPQIIIEQNQFLGPSDIRIALADLFDTVPPGAASADIVLTAQHLRVIYAQVLRFR